eukprot:25042-Pelagomonas_calceolata.AAC.3
MQRGHHRVSALQLKYCFGSVQGVHSSHHKFASLEAITRPKMPCSLSPKAARDHEYWIIPRVGFPFSCVVHRKLALEVIRKVAMGHIVQATLLGDKCA